MDQHTLLTVMTVFVIVAAVALMIQAAMLAGIYKASRGLQQNVQRLTPKIEGVLDVSQADHRGQPQADRRYHFQDQRDSGYYAPASAPHR